MVFAPRMERKKPQVRTRLRAEVSILANAGLIRSMMGTTECVKTIRRLFIRIALNRQYSASEMVHAKRIVHLAPLLSAKACRSDRFLLELYEKLGSLQASCFDDTG